MYREITAFSNLQFCQKNKKSKHRQLVSIEETVNKLVVPLPRTTGNYLKKVVLVLAVPLSGTAYPAVTLELLNHLIMSW